MCIHIYIYIYIYVERERERERLYISLFMYIVLFGFISYDRMLCVLLYCPSDLPSVLYSIYAHHSYNDCICCTYVLIALLQIIGAI